MDYESGDHLKTAPGLNTRHPDSAASVRPPAQHPPIVEDLTVVVPTLGRSVLRECLQSLVDCRSWPSRLIVVDQSGGKDVRRWVTELMGAQMDVLHVSAQRRGVAAAVNRGIERVETPFFAINHDDARVHPEWINCMWSRLQRSPGAVISGTVIPESPRVPSAITAGESVIHTRPLLTRDPLFANNMGTSLEVVHKVGRFDERRELAYAAEDNDWGYRALRAGVPIIHAPEVVVTHLDWRNDQELEETYRRYARAQGAFYGKYLRHGDLFIARRAVRDLLRGPWLVLRAFASPRNQELARMARAEITGILPGIVAGFLSERRHQRREAKGDHT